jgi:hypothetical protein
MIDAIYRGKSVGIPPQPGRYKLRQCHIVYFDLKHHQSKVDIWRRENRRRNPELCRSTMLEF